MKNPKINIALLSSSLYVAFQIFANILSTKITVLPILNMAIDGGTIIYPFTFTLRDFVHKTWGKKNSRQVVIIAGALNLLMVVLFWLIGQMPADASWPYQEAYQQILLPVWRITMGSIIAQIISELVDTEIFSLVYKKSGDVLGVLFSNSVALLVDSFIFTTIAFLGSLPLSVVGQIILTNIIVKFIISLISLPSIRYIPRPIPMDQI